MKKIKKIIAVSTAVLCLASALITPAFEIKTAAAEPDEYHDDWLHCEGNKVLDRNNNEVWLTGCNWFGYNVGSQVFDGVWSQNMHSMLTQIADHGFNFLRVPMSSQILLQWKNKEADPTDTPKVNTYSNPELSKTGVEGGDPMYSFDIWNLAVKWCRELGIKIMIDIHSVATNSAGHQIPVWYTSNYTADQWIESLEWFTDYYKDDDTILAIDLKNEPHGKAGEGTIAKWDNTSDENNWKAAAEKAGNAILDINPNLLIMVEGTEVYPKFDEGANWNSQDIDYARYPYSYYYHTWWGGNFRGEKDYPITFKNSDYQKQLVFSPHDYGPLVYKQTWFEGDFTYDSLMKDVWKDNWFFIEDQNIAPLLIGEWGGFIDSEHDSDGKNLKWMTYLKQLITKYHLNHTFWCFNENSGDTGGLVYDNFGKWDEEKYNFVETSLWQDSNGKYISLDHKTALGKNGVSLDEHYGNKTGQRLDDTSTSEEESTTSDVSKSDIISGDLNDDKKVNAKDLALMKKHVFGGIDEKTVLIADPADTNGNGIAYETADFVLLAKFVLGRDAVLKIYK